ncbi:MAG: hypothetical protein JST82_09085 [Bacteroidetes bacterium]|nr:hypothetical protein [Bacteroidota bacterium]
MRKIFFNSFIGFAVIAIACNKPSNQATEPVKTPDPTHYFSGKYQMYDSNYHYTTPDGYVFDTNWPINYVKDVFMDSTANYILAGKDTFKFNDTYRRYGISGYYNGLATPAGYYQIVVTKDTLKFIWFINGSIRFSTKTNVVGYRVP